MERLLVTGVDGPIGINLALKLAEHCQVLGLGPSPWGGAGSVQAATWEAGDGDALRQIAADWRPAWIVHCGPLATSSWDPEPPDAAVQLAPRVAAVVAEVAVEFGARLTVLSSDAVFGGPRLFHDETSAPTRHSPWAAQVREMERALAESEALIVRTHAYGWSPTDSQAGFAERALAALNSAAPGPADGRSHATPILATDLAELLWRAFQLRLHGLYHMAGAERASRFRFVTELARVFDLRLPSGLDPCAARASDDQHETSLSSKRARRQLEMPTPLLREGLERFAQQAQCGWREQVRRASIAPALHEVAA